MADLTLRPACSEDAVFVRDMSEIASFGLVSEIFRSSVPEGQDLGAHVLARIADPASKVSWTKCTIAELSGEPAGLINLDPIPIDPAPPDADTPALFRPLAELEAQAAGTVVIEFIATLPQARGLGVGTALLNHALARPGPNGVSLVVFDTNHTARRLYERAGFAETGRRPIVKGSWRIEATEWVLMTRP